MDRRRFRIRLRLGGIGEALADRNFRIFSIGSITSWVSFQRGRVMGTEFLFSRIAGGIGTYATAERHGLQLPMLIVALICLLAWGWAYAKRARIRAAFEPANPPSATALSP